MNSQSFFLYQISPNF